MHSFMLIDKYFTYPTQIVTKLNSSDLISLPGITVCFPIKFEGSKINSANEVFKMNFNSAGSVKCNLMKAPVSMEDREVAFVPPQMSCEDIADPVESINYGYGQKCSTYFSQQKGKNPMDFMVRKKNAIVGGNGGDIVDLEIEFPTFPGGNAQTDGFETRAALLMLHSPYEMPDWSEKVSKIKPSMEYVISFNKITERKMGPPFRDGCSSYESTGAEMRSNYDCVDTCLMNLFRSGCSCLPSNLNIRREMLYSGDRFCDDKRCFSLSSSEASACKELPQCRPNCITEAYEFASEVTPMMVPNVYYNRPPSPGRPGPAISDVTALVGNAAKAFITLRKSSTPDVTYEHKPEFDYRDFFFQIATLATVWLGMSVFGLFWKPVYFIGRILAKCFCLGETKLIPVDA